MCRQVSTGLDREVFERAVQLSWNFPQTFSLQICEVDTSNNLMHNSFSNVPFFCASGHHAKYHQELGQMCWTKAQIKHKHKEMCWVVRRYH